MFSPLNILIGFNIDNFLTNLPYNLALRCIFMTTKSILKNLVSAIFVLILCLLVMLYTTDAIDMIFVHPFQYWGGESFSEWWYYKSPIHYGVHSLLETVMCLVCLYCVLKYQKKYFGRVSILITAYLLWTFRQLIKIWIEHLFF